MFSVCWCVVCLFCLVDVAVDVCCLQLFGLCLVCVCSNIGVCVCVYFQCAFGAYLVCVLGVYLLCVWYRPGVWLVYVLVIYLVCVIV